MSTQASSTTPHYGLSQWDANDRILREDFNADLSAIDSALHAHDEAIQTVKSDAINSEAIQTLITANSPRVKLREYTGIITSNTPNWQHFRFEDVDLSQFSYIEIDIPDMDRVLTIKADLIYYGGRMDGKTCNLIDQMNYSSVDGTNGVWAGNIKINSLSRYGLLHRCQWITSDSSVPNSRYAGVRQTAALLRPSTYLTTGSYLEGITAIRVCLEFTGECLIENGTIVIYGVR